MLSCFDLCMIEDLQVIGEGVNHLNGEAFRRIENDLYFVVCIGVPCSDVKGGLLCDNLCELLFCISEEGRVEKLGAVLQERVAHAVEGEKVVANGGVCRLLRKSARAVQVSGLNVDSGLRDDRE